MRKLKRTTITYLFHSRSRTGAPAPGARRSTGRDGSIAKDKRGREAAKVAVRCTETR